MLLIEMKIAFLNIYNGVVNRGAETFVKELAKRLAKNHYVSVFQSGDKGKDTTYDVIKIPLKFDWSKKEVSKKLLRFLFLDYSSLQILKFTLRCLRRIYKEKYDIVIPVNGGWMPALIRIVTWLYGGKMIISGQAGIGWDEINNLWCFPDVFVSLSSFGKSWAKRVNPFVKVVRIPNGVDLKKFTPKGKRINHNLLRPVILCVGALTKTKRIDLTIKAVSRMEGVSLLVVGDGPEKEEIEFLGKKLLGRRFKLMKFPFERMPEVYRACDLFTLVSERYYSFEIVLVEAMASNLAVVANEDEIRKEIVKDAGILVDATNQKRYVDALKRALKKEWGKKPREQAKKFSWDKISKKYEDLFEEIL